MGQTQSQLLCQPASRVAQLTPAEPEGLFPKASCCFLRLFEIHICYSVPLYPSLALCSSHTDTNKTWSMQWWSLGSNPSDDQREAWSNGWELRRRGTGRSKFSFLFIENALEREWRQCFCTNKFKECLVGTFFFWVIRWEGDRGDVKSCQIWTAMDPKYVRKYLTRETVIRRLLGRNLGNRKPQTIGLKFTMHGLWVQLSRTKWEDWRFYK